MEFINSKPYRDTDRPRFQMWVRTVALSHSPVHSSEAMCDRTPHRWASAVWPHPAEPLDSSWCSPSGRQDEGRRKGGQEKGRDWGTREGTVQAGLLKLIVVQQPSIPQKQPLSPSTLFDAQSLTMVRNLRQPVMRTSASVCSGVRVRPFFFPFFLPPEDRD
jgi:hypothetical protein